MPERSEKQDWFLYLQELQCPESSANQILEALDDSDRLYAAQLLRIHKQALLQQLHEAEDRIDLADFLIYSLKKTGGK